MKTLLNLAVLGLASSFASQSIAQELMVAKSKAGDIWVWEMTDSKFDLSRLEIRRKNGSVERHVGSAPLMDNLIAASPRPATSSNEKVPAFPLRGDYKVKVAGSGMNLSYAELRCVRNCSAVEKELVFRRDPTVRLTWTAQ